VRRHTFVLTICLAAAGCAPAALPLRDDASSAASTQAAEAPIPAVPEISDPGTRQTRPVAAALYTCPMHPEVRSPQPGKCPSCGMTLERVEEKP
jgi:hypothetical protein